MEGGRAGGFACLATLDYRRKLPHWQPDHVPIFVTWRLWGTLPARRQTGRNAASCSQGEEFAAADRELDSFTRGPLWLNDERIAVSLAQAILIGETELKFYQLHAWSIMPNHVHLLITPRVPLPVVTRWLKGSTSRRANQVLGRTGQAFWQAESFDHWVRNQEEFHRIVRYIEWNPVKAGLIDSPELWPWSSAGWQAKPPALP